MAEYKHGALGNVNAAGTKVAEKSKAAMVYIGTAPVHTVENGEKNVNVPMLINDISEAKKYLGYSEDWASYTLCEPIHHHFETKGVWRQSLVIWVCARNAMDITCNVGFLIILYCKEVKKI